MGNFAEMLDEEQVEVLGSLMWDTSEISSPKKPFELIEVSVFRSGYISGEDVQDMLQYDQATNKIIFRKERTFLRRGKKIFSDKKFGPQKKPKNSFVLVRGESANVLEAWVSKVLLFFQSPNWNVRESTKFSFLKYFQTCKTQNWNTCRAEVHMIEMGNERWGRDAAHQHNKTQHTVLADSWLQFAIFYTIEGTVHITWAKFSIHPHKPESPFRSSRFYMNNIERNLSRRGRSGF